MRFTKKPEAKGGRGTGGGNRRVPASKRPQQAPLWAEHLLQRAPAKTKWAGGNVKISEEVLGLIQGIFSPEAAAHLRMRRKRLQINLRHEQPDDPFRWGLLKEIIESGERLVIELSDTFRYTWHQKVDGEIVSEDVAEELPIDGVTLASQSLTKRTTGELVGMTSQEEDVSYIYLRPGMATASKMAHELLGHFYLDVRNVPSGHTDKLTEEHGILDPSGKPFTGRVHDFIQQHIELDDIIEPYDPITYE